MKTDNELIAEFMGCTFNEHSLPLASSIVPPFEPIVNTTASDNRTFTTCNGKISQSGFCDKCSQSSQGTSAYCGRLIEVVPSPVKTAEEVLKEVFGEFDYETLTSILTKEAIGKIFEAMKLYNDEINRKAKELD